MDLFGFQTPPSSPPTRRKHYSPRPREEDEEDDILDAMFGGVTPDIPRGSIVVPTRDRHIRRGDALDSVFASFSPGEVVKAPRKKKSSSTRTSTGVDQPDLLDSIFGWTTDEIKYPTRRQRYEEDMFDRAFAPLSPGDIPVKRKKKSSRRARKTQNQGIFDSMYEMVNSAFSDGKTGRHHA